MHSLSALSFINELGLFCEEIPLLDDRWVRHPRGGPRRFSCKKLNCPCGERILFRRLDERLKHVRELQKCLRWSKKRVPKRRR